MSKLIENSLEILLSLFIVFGLLYVAFEVKPEVSVPKYTPTMFGLRDHYYSVVSPGENKQIIWAVGNEGRVIRSEDAGKQWRIQETGTKANLQSIAAWDSSSAIVIGDLATVLITGDSGKAWAHIAVKTYQYGDQFLKVYIDHDKGNAWLSGTMSTVMLSKDRGKTWHLVHKAEDIAWNDITVAPDGSVWVVGEFGRMQRSRDEGTTWEEVKAPTSGSSLMSIAFSDSRHGIAVGLSGIVVTTEDGGAHWSRVPAVTHAHLFDILWDGQEFLAVGANGVFAGFSPDGHIRKVSRIHPDNSGWYTQINRYANDDYLIAGTNLGLRNKKGWFVYQ